MADTTIDSRFLDALPAGFRLERYVIRSVLGQGGFGVTYEAEHEKLQHRVAIKELFVKDHMGRRRDGRVTLFDSLDPPFFARLRDKFEAEARKIAGRFDHPNVVSGHDFFEANDTFYVVMRFVPGISFKDWLAARTSAPSEAELRPIFEKIFDAVGHIHDRGDVHRDLKPANVMIRPDGQPVVIDLGASATTLDAEETRSLVAAATPAYAAPEQLAPESGVKPRPYTDVFALGGMLYESVTGRRPAAVLARAAAVAQLTGADPYVPAARAVRNAAGYSATFLSGIDRALRLDPAERPQSTADLAAALGWSDAPAPARSAPLPLAPRAPPARRWRRMAGVVVLVLAFAGLAAVAWQREWPAEIARRAALVLPQLRPTAVSPATAPGDPSATAPLAEASRPAQRDDEARQEAEQRRRLEEARRAEQERAAEAARRADEARRAAEAAQKAEAARRAEDARQAEEGRRIEAARRIEEAEKRAAAAEAARKAAEEDARKQTALAEDARRRAEETDRRVAADLARRQEEERQAAEAARKAESLKNCFKLALQPGHPALPPGEAGVEFEVLDAARAVPACAAATEAAPDDPSAPWAYARTLLKAGRETEALTWTERGAALGDATALFGLGSIYGKGRGVPQDFAKAREWYEKAAALGQPDAIANLGFLYLHGQGVPRDPAKAREFFARAADLGNVGGMTGLAFLYFGGQGVAQDYAKARLWYEKAASLGNAGAMASLGVIYAQGLGVTADEAKARDWFEKAVALGHVGARYALALLLDDGKGGPKDNARAAALLLEAQRGGHADAAAQIREGLKAWDVETRRAVQRQLASAGLYRGPIDGVIGEEVRRAVQAFARAK